MINFDKFDKFNYPYPYMSTDNCFVDEDLDNLISEFPDVSTGNLVMGGRRQKDAGSLNTWLKSAPTWKRFYNYLNTKDRFDHVAAQYSEELNRWGSILTKESGPTTDSFLHIDWSEAGDGYTREIHRDTDPRIWNFIIFFNDKDWEGGDFIIHSSDELKTFPRQLFNQTLPVHKTIEAKKNRAVFFLSVPNSYHSVSLQKNTKTPRKFIYGAYTMKNNRDVFRKRHTNE